MNLDYLLRHLRTILALLIAIGVMSIAAVAINGGMALRHVAVSEDHEAQEGVPLLACAFEVQGGVARQALAVSEALNGQDTSVEAKAGRDGTEAAFARADALPLQPAERATWGHVEGLTRQFEHGVDGVLAQLRGGHLPEARARWTDVRQGMKGQLDAGTAHVVEDAQRLVNTLHADQDRTENTALYNFTLLVGLVLPLLLGVATVVWLHVARMEAELRRPG